MGKDLHYSIRPFIEQALKNHSAVKEFKEIKFDVYYGYKIIRNKGMSDVMVVLSDAYFFGTTALQSILPLVKDGGFILIAKPEASGNLSSIPIDKIGIGKLGKFLGALNRDKFWTYEPPEK